MTNDELKAALLSRKPVIAHMYISVSAKEAIEYAYVSGIIYRLDANGKIKVQAEITDKCLHSVTIIDPSQLTMSDNESDAIAAKK